MLRLFLILVIIQLVVNSTASYHWLKWKHKKKIETTKIIPIVFTTSHSTTSAKNSFSPLKFLEKNGYGLGMISRQRVFSETPQVSPVQIADEIKKMVSLFQKLHHLNVTGELDEQTLAKMKSPSCANPDIIIQRNFRRKERYLDDLDFKWGKNKLSYKILNLDKTLKEYTKDAIRQAFEYWQEATEFVFIESSKNSPADIEIDFVPRDHSDGFPFDDSVEELAHAFFPEDGRIHFYNKKLFTENSTEGYNLRIVAAHEIGHVLGLHHSSETGSLMNKFYPGFIPDFKLPDIDRKQIRELYNLSERTTTTKTSIKPTKNPINFNYRIYDPCTKEIDAIFYDQSKKYIYVLINDRKNRGLLWRYEIDKHKWDTIPLYSTYQDMLASFRGGFNYNNITWFIKGRRIFAYNNKKMLLYGYPRYVRDPLYPNNAYTAVNKNGDIYVLKGSFAFNLNLETLRLSEPYPDNLVDVFPGIPWWIESSLDTGDFIYFFKDNWVYKFDLKLNSVENGYPKIKHRGWFACMA